MIDPYRNFKFQVELGGPVSARDRKRQEVTSALARDSGLVVGNSMVDCLIKEMRRDMEEVILRSGIDYRDKICRCAICGNEQMCVPAFDYYSEEDVGLLRCEICTMQKGVSLKSLGMMNGGPNEKFVARARVKVIEGVLKGYCGVIEQIGIFGTLSAEESPVTVVVSFPSAKEGEFFSFGKMPKDLELLEEDNAERG